MKTFKKIHFRNCWWKSLLAAILCIGVVVGAGFGIAGIIKLTDGSMDTKKISSTKFTVGGLDTNGKYMNTNASIYTKDAFECQGLEVSLDFDNTVDYQIYFYDQNNDFVHTTGRLTGAFVKDSVPFFAKYARIVVTPKEDDVVTALEVSKYAKQLTIKVNREQGFKNYTENLIVNKTMSSKLSDADGSVTVGDSGWWVSDFINVSGYNEVLVFKLDKTAFAGSNLYFYGADNKYITYKNIASNSISFTSSTGTVYYSFDLKKVNLESFQFIRLSSNSGVELYCR